MAEVASPGAAAGACRFDLHEIGGMSVRKIIRQDSVELGMIERKHGSIKRILTFGCALARPTPAFVVYFSDTQNAGWYVRRAKRTM